MTYFQELETRGLVHNFTPQVAHYFQESKDKGQIPSVYCGFDPSGASLQVGNLMAVLLLRRAQLFGAKPLVLLGGATGLIGDPSGKKAERNLLDQNIALENQEKIKKQLSKFIDMDPGPHQGTLVNNYDWFKDINFVSFLRDVGKHITINYMMAKDSVKLRMETGISYAEFGYMLMQGYDFLHLFEKFGCRVQLGGSDQWGNITTGMELIRRKHGEESHAISSPLLTDASGNKLGKTEGGAIFLDAELTSPFQMYQYFLNVADTECDKLLKALTLLPLDEIKGITTLMQSQPEERPAQKLLAYKVTELVHNKAQADSAIKASQVLFSKDIKVLDSLSAQDLITLSREVPASQRTSVAGLGILDLLVQSGLCESKGEARRHISGGAVHINRVKIQDEKMQLSDDLLNNKGFMLIGLGKTKLHLVVKQN